VNGKKLHNEERNNCYVSSNFVRMKESRNKKWAEHTALSGQVKNGYESFN
jgi:hypothetical protein